MTDLCMFLLVTLDRPVIDKTGITGRFNFHLELPVEVLGFFHGPHGIAALSGPGASETDPALVSAIKNAIQQLGLKLDPINGPGELLVIDSVERPSEK